MTDEIADLLLFGGTVIDGTGAGPYRADVAVTGDVVSAVDTGRGRRSGRQVVDCSGRFVIPGLWDTHVHITQDGSWTREFPGHFDLDLVVANLRASLRWGVTSVIDVMGDPAGLATLKARQRAGDLADAATLYIAGPGVTAPGGHPVSTMMAARADVAARLTRQAADAAAARDAVDEIVDSFGVDLIKAFYTSLWAQRELTREDVLAATVDAAEARGRPVVAHVDWGPEAAEAIRCGVSGLEHICRPGSRSEAVRLAAEGGVIWTPTLAVFDAFAHAGDHEWLGQQRAHGADAAVLSSLTARGSKWLEPVGPRVTELMAGRLEGTRRAHQNGVALSVGTDAGANGTFHGIAVHRELELLVEAGLTPVEAITAATATAARKIRSADSVGTIAPGMTADLVLLDRDPSTDVANTRAIAAVIRGGRLVSGDLVGHVEGSPR